GAEEFSMEAIQIRRALAAEVPSVHLPGLANSLNNYGIILADLDLIEDAEKTFQEAIELGQELLDSSKNSPMFAESCVAPLHNLLLLLSKHKKDSKRIKDIKNSLLDLGSGKLPSDEWSWNTEEEDLWFHEVFYHWVDCPFCV
ncbi:MAG: tetratricopeptide repeat protein, partial [Candidatus Thorarchaeota archaeon]